MGKHIEEYALAHAISLPPMSYKMYVMFPGSWAQDFVGRFQTGVGGWVGITAETYVFLDYFAVSVSSLNIL